MNRWLSYLVVTYHLTQFQVQLIRNGVYLIVALLILAIILAIKKVLEPSPQSAAGARRCPACGAASSGVRFCPECGQKMS